MNDSLAVSGDLVITGIPTSTQALGALATGQKLFVDGGEDPVTQADVLARVLDATTEGEVWAEGTLQNVTSHLGERLTITGIQGARNSDVENSVLGIFLIVNAVDADGESFSLAVGSPDPVIKLLRHREVGTWPIVVKFWENAKAQKPGQNAPINISMDPDATKRARGDSSF